MGDQRVVQQVRPGGAGFIVVVMTRHLHRQPCGPYDRPSPGARSMTDELLYDQRGGIGYVTFNRPLARNALTFPMYERLAEIAANPNGVRVLIVTGSGDKAFAAGTDINQFRDFSGADDALAYEAR